MMSCEGCHGVMIYDFMKGWGFEVTLMTGYIPSLASIE
jgi:hypothetical protein